jgi:hypothetical protein
MPELPDLIITTSQTKVMPARLYNYNEVNIENNATLKFSSGGTQWAIIKCDKLILEGTIEYTNMRRGLGKVTANIDELSLEYKFPELSIGGGGSSGLGLSTGAVGGNGYYPSNTPDGGGGGGGGYYKNKRPTGRTVINGVDADSFRGSRTVRSEKKGGDGGRLYRMSNGGLLLIIANEISSNNSAKIILTGENGTNGNSGSEGFYNMREAIGNCGNGGGSAGGDGGVLVVNFKNINDYPKTLVDGGNGGKGGISTNGHTQNGENGENGVDGYADWISVQ